jgi:RNA 2',3'-cyclic 3'-phosphodiesterase
MRLFVAIELEEQTVAAAAETAALLRRDIGSTLTASWVAPENMHLTVRFIGHVDDSRVPAILEVLTPPLDVAPFHVAFGACGMFPPSGPPRVIWIGLAEGLPSLAAIHHEFDRRLLPFGFEPERRPFSAHLTLARIKDAPKGARAALRDALAGADPRVPESAVNRATIFRSHLSPKGPRYERLAFARCRG